MATEEVAIWVQDDEPATATLRNEVLSGMRQPEKRLPSKCFYDIRGCELFEQICELDEYYLTRTELSIMSRDAREMAEQIGSSCMLIELGSGSSTKTRLLLDELDQPAAYVPVDIAMNHMQLVAAQLNRHYADLEVLPVCADFTQPFQLPQSARPINRRIVYFPGSTIGNLEADETGKLLRQIDHLCHDGGGLLIGIDLHKDTEILEAAYNDAKGITAQFNLNLLKNVNRQLDSDFQPDHFRHHAFYNQGQTRIEMHLVSRTDQSVTIAGETFRIGKGESICTEFSHKYNLQEFIATAAEAGLSHQRTWTDSRRRFAVVLFRTD